MSEFTHKTWQEILPEELSSNITLSLAKILSSSSPGVLSLDDELDVSAPRTDEHPEYWEKIAQWAQGIREVGGMSEVTVINYTTRNQQP